MNMAESEKALFEHLFPEKSRVLIRALCGAGFNQESADVLTKNLNIDKAESMYLLLLGIIGYRRGWEYFPEDGVPRFKGLHKYYQVRNAAEAASLNKRLDNLGAENIPVMLSGAAATRTHYLSDTPRMIGAYDVTVPSEKYEKASSVFDRGAAVSAVTETEQGLVKEPLFRLHRGTPDRRIFSETDVWGSTLKINVLEHEVYVPSPGHSLLYHLCVPYAGWVTSERPTERALRMAEAINLISKSADPESFAAAAKSTGLTAPARLYFMMLNGIIPEAARAEEFLIYLPEDDFYGKYINELANICEKTAAYSASLSLAKRASLHFARKRIYKTLEKRKR